MKKSSARTVALDVLESCRRSGAWADAALKAQLDRTGLSGPEAALCSRIVYGVVQNQLLLDYYLSACCSQKPEHLQLPLLNILRIGAYQVLFLDKVPDSAAVNESVELAKLSGRGQASGLVNAVLRKLSKNKFELPALPAGDPLKRMALQYSHPKWLVKRLTALLGTEETESFLAMNNQIAPLTAQVNSLKITREELIRELEADGVSVKPHSWVTGSLALSGTGDVTALKAFQEGHFLIQDPAAALTALCAGLQSGNRVLDVCAAPGGKTFGAAIAMEDQGSVLACDLHANKLSRIQEGARRLGLGCVETAVADGRDFHPQWENGFDAVLVDAPCSGLGIIRKKPDIRYKKADDLFTLPVIQSAILENTARYVKPGGTLLYSTCTILPEENQDVTEGFLARHPDFSREKLPLSIAEGTDGQITLWPQRHDTDGFYICRMKRNT